MAWLQRATTVAFAHRRPADGQCRSVGAVVRWCACRSWPGANMRSSRRGIAWSTAWSPCTKAATPAPRPCWPRPRKTTTPASSRASRRVTRPPRRGDLLSAAAHQAELLQARTGPGGAANTPQLLLEQAQPRNPWPCCSRKSTTSPWRRVALLLRAEALVATQRAGDALALIDAIRAGQGLSPDAAGRAGTPLAGGGPGAVTGRRRLAAALARPAGAAAASATRSSPRSPRAPRRWAWKPRPPTALAEAIDRQWNDARVTLCGRVARGARRHAPARAPSPGWPRTRPMPRCLLAAGSPVPPAAACGARPTNSCTARSPKAPAPTPGKNSGTLHTAQDQAERAQASYANALRVARGEPVRALDGRSLREQIAAEAVAEQRNEHGLPQLPR